MIKENLIFRIALVVSATIHIGGAGLLVGGNSSFLRNGIGNIKNNVVVFEIGWIPSQKQMISQNNTILDTDEKGPHNIMQKQEIKRRRRVELNKSEKTETFSKRGSSGYSEENAGGMTSQYLLEVRKRIESSKFYPEAAKRRFIRGSVTLNFYIDENGKSEDIKVTKSSGLSMLDNTAREIILLANPFPKPPDGKSAELIQTTIVFEL